MTIARAEMSTNSQSSQPQVTGSKSMSVALIGPNDAHRKIVAQALASSQGRKIHEFIDYPGNLNDLSRMLEQNFDVVLVDVDTDQSYALQIIEKLSSLGASVMAYSARTDQDLLMNCMRAGACDFVPLPTEDAAEPKDIPQTETPAVQQIAPKPPEPKPASVPAPVAARSNITPIVPERRYESALDARPPAIPEERLVAPAIPEHQFEAVSQVRPPAVSEEHLTPLPAAFTAPSNSVAPAEKSQTEDVLSDFAKWDAANLRPAPPAAPVKKPESRPRPSLVPDRRKIEPAVRVAPVVEETPAPVIERPPIAAELFRSSQFKSESEPNEAAEKQGAKWVKWILIAAGPLVLALVLLIVFTRPSTPNPAAARAKEAPSSTPEEKETQPNSQLIVNATGKTSPATPATAKPSPAQQSAPAATADSTPVSPDAMAAQLVAPTRIAGTIKKTAPVDEPPPAAPAAVAFDDSGTVPGSVFGGAGKVKVAPHVVGISAGVADGMILRKTPPVYPKFAQEAHITGKVVLKATITKQGNIEGVQVLSGPKILAPPAVDAVKTWKYRPYMLDGQPVAVETSVTVVFGMAGK